MFYHTGESPHTQTIQINKVIGENEKRVFYFTEKPNGLFGQPNVITGHYTGMFFLRVGTPLTHLYFIEEPSTRFTGSKRPLNAYRAGAGLQPGTGQASPSLCWDELRGDL